MLRGLAVTKAGRSRPVHVGILHVPHVTRPLARCVQPPLTTCRPGRRALRLPGRPIGGEVVLGNEEDPGGQGPDETDVDLRPEGP